MMLGATFIDVNRAGRLQLLVFNLLEAVLAVLDLTQEEMAEAVEALGGLAQKQETQALAVV